MEHLTDELPDDFFDDGSADVLGEMMIDEIVSGIENDYATELDESARSVRLRHRQKMVAASRQENLSALLPQLPEPGESIHLLGCNLFDAWCFVPVGVALLGGRIDELYISTWMITHRHMSELVELIDAGKVRSGFVSIITSLVFKRRRPESYALMIAELIGKGKGRYLQTRTHAKVSLFCNWKSDQFIVVETSANMSINNNLEQTAVHNSRELYDFYRTEFETIFDRGSRRELHW